MVTLHQGDRMEKWDAESTKEVEKVNSRAAESAADVVSRPNPSSRRTFLTGIGPGAVSLALLACGKVVENKKKVVVGGNKANGANGGSGSDANGVKGGDSTSSGGSDPNVTGSPGPTSGPTVEPSASPTAGADTIKENCMLQGDEKINLAKISDSGNIVTTVKIYGNKTTRRHILLVAKLGTDVAKGDLVTVVAKSVAAETSGYVLGAKIISQNDLDFGLQLDGLNLVGKLELAFIVTSGTNSKKQLKSCANADFSSSYAEKEVIDVTGLVVLNAEMKTLYGNKTPLQSWVLNSNTAVTDAAKVQTITARKIEVAKSTTTWDSSTVPAIMKATGTVTTTLLGDVVSVSQLETLLQVQNTFIVYVPMDAPVTKYFRYFIFLG